MPANALGRRPVPLVLAGALAISFSAILYRYSEVSPSTGAFFRCLWALPPLWLIARLEDRRFGARARRARMIAWSAGVFFAADLILWHHAIEQVGAGLATVLGTRRWCWSRSSPGPCSASGRRAPPLRRSRSSAWGSS
jgi:drug/metabolite transporter (DMT)-like permease